MKTRHSLLFLSKISAGSVLLVVLVSALVVLTSTLAAAASLNETVIARELQRAQSGPDSVASVTIAAPVAFVFEFLTNRPHDYTDDAASVAFDHSNSEVPDGMGRGSIRTITRVNGETLFQRFLMFNRPMTYAYLTDMDQSTASLPLNYSIARYELTEITDSSTALRVALVYQPSSRLLAFFVRRAFNSALQSDFERAAEIIETAWQTGA